MYSHRNYWLILAICGKNETYILCFLLPRTKVQETIPRHCFMLASNRAYLLYFF